MVVSLCYKAVRGYVISSKNMVQFGSGMCLMCHLSIGDT